MSRASTSWRFAAKEDVDGRVKPGHDGDEGAHLPVGALWMSAMPP
jgi:hypothetical protein